MEKEHRQLLQSSVDSIKGLAKAFSRDANESNKQSNVAHVARSKSSKQEGNSIGLLQDIKKLLQAQFKFTKARDKESEFESDRAKKGARFKMFESKKKEPREEGGGILSKMKGMGWVKILLLIIAGIIAFGAGTIIGIFQSIFNFFKWLGKIFPRLGKLFANIGKFFKPIIQSVKNFFGRIGNFFAKIFGKNSAIGKVFAKVTKFLKPIITIIGKLFGGGAGGGFFKTLKKVMGLFFKVGKVFGKLLGPIGLVITIVMALFDFVKGFKGTEGGFFQKLMGGLGGLFAGLIGMPLDLIKNAIAWIFEKFGWTKLAAKMKEFSFSDIIKDFFKFIPKLVGIIKDFFKESPIGKVIGTLIKIIFWPITLIIKAVKAIIKLFKRDKPEGETKKIGVLGKIFGFLWKVISWPFRMIIKAVKAVIKFIGRLIGKIKDFFANNPIGKVIAKVIGVITWPITLIKNFLEGFKGTEGGFFDKVIGGFKHVWEKVKGFFSSLIPQFVKDFFARDPEGEVSGIREVIQKIGGFFAIIGGAFGTAFHAVVDGIEAAIKWVWNTGEPLGILNKIGGFFSRIANAFIAWTEESELIKRVQEVLDKVKDFLRKVGRLVVGGELTETEKQEFADAGVSQSTIEDIEKKRGFFGQAWHGLTNVGRAIGGQGTDERPSNKYVGLTEAEERAIAAARRGNPKEVPGMQTGGTVLRTGLAKIHQGELIINPRQIGGVVSQLSALSGQLAVQAAGGMSGGSTGGDTNVTTVAPVTNNNTEINRIEPGVVESTLSKINQDYHNH